MKIRNIGEVQRLPRNVTPDMLDNLIENGDFESFDNLVAADALVPGLPCGLAAWLQRGDNITDWVAALTIKVFDHQVRWCRERSGLGESHADTRLTQDRLRRLRERHAEALELLHAATETVLLPTATARARRRLREKYAREYEAYIEEQRRIHGALDDLVARSPRGARLLKMSDAEFDKLVAADVMERALSDDLAEVAVGSRWRDALIRLGDRTLSEMGMPPSKREPKNCWFMVSDALLPDVPTAAWVRQMSLLARVQACLFEAQELRRRTKREIAEFLHLPAEERLVKEHFAEYAEYRLEEERQQKPPGRDHMPRLYPFRFPALREVMVAAGMDVVFVRKGDVAWLEARRGTLLMTVRGKRRTSRESSWKSDLKFFIRRAGAWFLVEEKEFMKVAAAETPEQIARELGKLKRFSGEVHRPLESLVDSSCVPDSSSDLVYCGELPC